MPANRIRTYTELSQLKTFKERFEYLKLDGVIGMDTFGHSRYLNQYFYRTPEWKRIRDLVIIRDNCCDLGVPGYELDKHVYIHHMNPITREDILNHSMDILNPEYLITVSMRTHNAIHYSDESQIFTGYEERKPNDTCPWK